MIEFPPLPAWDAFHPLVIHFPVALLLVAPIFVVVGVVLAGDRGRAFLITALVLMALGTVGTYVAVSTGEAAGELAQRNPAISAVLQHHEQLAEATRVVFSALTLIFSAILFVPVLLKRSLGRGMATALIVIFLAGYGAGSVLLANTAHNGGRLVHELGVRALMSSQPLPDTKRARFERHENH
ncbi:MAG TPA: DUF2231 domain-containing protein [Thermoanaerobaculia bacterium]|nr:DUF2231 domain-containing protein [Thermoanaerobaculia bacterium]